MKAREWFFTATTAVVFALVGYGIVTSQPFGRSQPWPVHSQAAEPLSYHPLCTPTWPRGFQVAKFKGTKKRPIKLCTNGDIQSTWGGCVERRGV